MKRQLRRIESVLIKVRKVGWMERKEEKSKGRNEKDKEGRRERRKDRRKE